MKRELTVVSRRAILRGLGAGSLLLVSGGLLQACGGAAAPSTSAAPPSGAGSAPKPSSAAASSAPASSPTASPAASSPAATSAGAPLKLGVLSCFTGAQAQPGLALANGTDLFLNSTGGKLGGRAVQVAKEDEASDPKAGLEKAKKLIEQDRVDILTGVILSSTAYAISDYLKTAARKVMFLISNAGGTEFDTTRKSDYVVRVSFSNAQHPTAMGPYVFKDMKLKNVFIATRDDAAGHEKVDPFKKAFTQAGGKIAGELYAPFGAADYAPYLAKIKQAQPEAVWAFYAGPEALRFVQQYAQYGLKSSIKLLGVGDLVDEDVLPAQGEAAVGAITAYHWAGTLDNPENKKFEGDYKAKFNKDADGFAVAGWDAGYALNAALAKTNGDPTPAKLLNALLGLKWNSPRGPMSISPEYHDVIQNVYVRETKMVNGKPANVVTHTFEAQLPI